MIAPWTTQTAVTSYRSPVVCIEKGRKKSLRTKSSIKSLSRFSKPRRERRLFCSDKNIVSVDKDNPVSRVFLSFVFPLLKDGNNR